MKIVVEIYKPFLQLIIECIVHLLQPYPGVRYEWKVIYLGFEIMFNLNMLFFFFCSLRIYIIVKAIRYWNLFSQNTSIHMLRLFNELSNPYFFFYKSNLKRNGLITLFLLGAFSLIYFSLIFQVLEYFKKDISNEYYYFVNCIWYLIVTMCTGIFDIKNFSWLWRLHPKHTYRKSCCYSVLFDRYLYTISTCVNTIALC